MSTRSLTNHTPEHRIAALATAMSALVAARLVIELGEDDLAHAIAYVEEIESPTPFSHDLLDTMQRFRSELLGILRKPGVAD